MGLAIAFLLTAGVASAKCTPTIVKHQGYSFVQLICTSNKNNSSIFTSITSVANTGGNTSNGLSIITGNATSIVSVQNIVK